MSSAESAIAASQVEALQLMVPPDQYNDYLEQVRGIEEITNNPYLGSFTVGAPGKEKLVHAFRAQSGPGQNAQGQRRVHKGGLRKHMEFMPDPHSNHVTRTMLNILQTNDFVTDVDPEMPGHTSEVSRLAIIMQHKAAEVDEEEGYAGGKGLFVVQTRESSPTRPDRPQKLTSEEDAEAMEKYYLLMRERGYANHEVDVPAGDVGVGPVLLDVYSATHRRLNPKDPYADAVITGTSVKYGGVKAKETTTGLGTYEAHDVINGMFGGRFRSIAFRGFGAANSWYAINAARNPGMSVQAISDIDATLYTPDPNGFEPTPEMAAATAAEPFNKMRVLHTMLSNAQRGLPIEFLPSDAIYDLRTDAFSPGALGDDIDPVNADRLRRSGRQIVFEVANEPTTSLGHQGLRRSAILTVPDIVANAQGVKGSMILHKARRAEADRRAAGEKDVPTITDQELIDAVVESSQRTTQRMFEVAQALGTNDWRVAASAISMTRLIVAFGGKAPDIISEYIK